MTVLDMGMGPVNGHIVGRVVKESVRRAMVIAKLERDVFEAHTKPDYSGQMDKDVFTSADTKAQAIYVRMIEECFPNAGIIGEEKSPGSDVPLFVPPKNGCRAYFTLDPIDGTRAYIRRQSHGIASMIALVLDGTVISAYVADIMANELIGYRPESDHVFRISGLDHFEELREPKPTALTDLYVMLRDPPHWYSEHAQTLLPRFKNYEIMGSSIGTWMARLWKREVGAMLMSDGDETPWDSTPIIGITRKLGYVFMRPKTGDGWEVYEPELPVRVTNRPHDTLIVHANIAEQFE
ncbi:MAG: hypothetical protein KBD06_01360 [Candidatus Pacebacteria bacterium]|nr:hypothetical protein [Candidatus Paceibacterota bacterium]